MATLRRSLVLSFTQRYCELGINAASIVILARLLTPAELGVYAVAAAVVALAQVLRDFGVSNYIIQEKDLTAARIRTAVNISILLSWSVGGIVVGVSGLVSRFYSEPALREILLVLGINFLLIPFSASILALLRREMAFGQLYVIGTLSVFSQATTAIVLAFMDYGVMALACGSVVAGAVTVIMANYFRPANGIYRLCLKEWRHVAAFGMLSGAADAVNQIGIYAPDFILGRVIGFTSVGLYGRASSLVQMFNQSVMHAVMPVMLPAFSERIRLGEDSLFLYLKGLSYVTVLAWPFFIFLGFMAGPVVGVAFGDQWGAAVPIVQILCLVGIFRPLFYFSAPALIAMGKVGWYFGINAMANGLAIMLIFGGAVHSLEAAALSPAVVCMVYFFLSFLPLRRFIGLSFRSIIRSISKSALVTSVCGLVPIGVSRVGDVEESSLMLQLASAFLGTAALWIFLVFAVRHPIRDEVRLLWHRRGTIRGRVGRLAD